MSGIRDIHWPERSGAGTGRHIGGQFPSGSQGRSLSAPGFSRARITPLHPSVTRTVAPKDDR